MINWDDGPPSNDGGLYFVWDITWDCNDEPWEGYYDYRERVLNWLTSYNIPHTVMADPRSTWGEEEVLVLHTEEDFGLYRARWESGEFSTWAKGGIIEPEVPPDTRTEEERAADRARVLELLRRINERIAAR